MRVTENVSTNCGQSSYEVRELTVGEIRQWQAALAASAEQQVDVVDAALFEIPLADLKTFLVGEVDFDSLTQSDIRKLIDAAKRLNPDFFEYRAKLWDAGKAFATGQQAP